MLVKPLLFSIKPGVVVAWNARTVIIIAPIDGSSNRVRDVATGKEHDVRVDELQGIPAVGQVTSDEDRWALVRDSTRAERKEARRRERVLNRCILGDGDASARVQFACKAETQYLPAPGHLPRRGSNVHADSETSRDTPSGSTPYRRS
jgi:hypothetical protein